MPEAASRLDPRAAHNQRNFDLLFQAGHYSAKPPAIAPTSKPFGFGKKQNNLTPPAETASEVLQIQPATRLAQGPNAVPLPGDSGRHGQVYGGPLLVPLVGGAGGGGGGGAILICSDTRIIHNGIIKAIGGGGFMRNMGSGGAIRLVAPKVQGAGSTHALGGSTHGLPRGSNGRLRMDTHDRTQFATQHPSEGVFSHGSFVVARLANEPALRVLKVAGQDPPANGDPVVLPINSSSTQTIRIEAANFGQSIQVEVALKPVNGPATSHTVTIDNTTENPKTVDVPVEVPGNTLLHVEVYKR